MYLDEFVKELDSFKNLKKEIRNNIVQNCYILNSNDKNILYSFSYLLASRLVERSGYKLENNLELQLNIKTYSENEKMKVEVAQEIIQKSQLPPKLPNSSKVFILDFINTPTVIVQNKLLKTIEEPYYGAKYIIKTNNYYSIIDTIKSRSRLINIKSIKKDEMFKLLSKKDITRYEFEKAYSVNKEISDLLDVIFKKDLSRMKLRDMVIYTLNNLYKKNINQLISRLKNQIYNLVDKYLDIFLLFTKDIIESRINNEVSISEKELDRYFTDKFFLKIQDSIFKALTNFRYNQNNDFIIRNFILEIMEDSYKCKE